jgi:hypothetical protein
MHSPVRVPNKPNGAISVARPLGASIMSTLVNPVPYDVRHSSTLSSTLFNLSDMAGHSDGQCGL